LIISHNSFCPVFYLSAYAISITNTTGFFTFIPISGGVPFVHSHRQNEEIYAVLSGKGAVVFPSSR
jgi:mannose-6-phosphate isomerase-like protein (cupin superfamily)